MKNINFFRTPTRLLQIGVLMLLTVFGTGNAVAQDYYITYQEGIEAISALNRGNPNEILGGSIGSFNEQMSAIQLIPFPFTFYGQAVTSYKASDNGYITFDVAQTASVSDNDNYTLPTNAAPTNAIFAYWDDHELNTAAGGITDVMHNFTYGDVGNRVHVIAWLSVSRVGIMGGFNTFAIRLYENNEYDFDVVYQWGSMTANVMTATLGCQDASGTKATVFTGSPNLQWPNLSGAGGTPPPLGDAHVYAFRTGTQPANDALLKGFRLPILVKQNTPSNLTSELFNHGSAPINTISIAYTINGGAQQIFSPTLAQPIPPNGKYSFTHSIPFPATDLGTNDIDLFVSAINGGADGVPDTLREDPFVHEGINAPSKKVIMEEFSTAPCQFCPDAVSFINQIENSLGDKAIIAQHHAGFGTDAMTIPAHQTYASFFATGAPTAAFDRVYNNNNGAFAYSRSDWPGQAALAATSYYSPASVRLETYYNPTSRQVDLDVRLNFNDITREETRLTVWVLEDSVTGVGSGYDQVNFYNGQVGHPFFGAGDPIVGYVHRHVVREVITDTWGDALSQAPTKGSAISETFSFQLSPNYDADQVSIVAFLNLFVEDPDDPTVDDYYEIFNADKEPLVERGLAIDNQLVAEGFSSYISPNPANSAARAHFELGETADLNISLVDMMGKTLKNIATGFYTAGAHDVSFDVSDLSNGVYMIRFQSERGVQTQRLVVAK